MGAIPSLPAFPGPYEVGVFDLEVDQILCRLYYPIKRQRKSRSRAYWLPRALFNMTGYGTYAKLPWILSMIVAPFAGFIRTATFVDQPLLEDIVSFPVVVFSHGIAGMRTTYSNLCGSLAAKGLIVFAIEHAEGSASGTSRRGNTVDILYQVPDARNATPGQSETEYLFKLRSEQLNFRVNEVLQTVSLIQSLNDGDVSNKNYYESRYKNMSLKCLQGRLDVTNMFLIGHSFGAATTLSVLDKKHPFKCGIALDPWFFPMQESLEYVKTPYLTIQSEFFHWPENAKRLLSFYEHPKSHSRSQFGYFLKTAHQDCSDLLLIVPSLLAKLSKRKTLPGIVQHKLMDEWMCEYLCNFLENDDVRLGKMKECDDLECVLVGSRALSVFKDTFELAYIVSDE